MLKVYLIWVKNLINIIGLLDELQMKEELLWLSVVLLQSVGLFFEDKDKVGWEEETELLDVGDVNLDTVEDKWLTSILLSSQSLPITVPSCRREVDICAKDSVVSFSDLLKGEVGASDVDGGA